MKKEVIIKNFDCVKKETSVNSSGINLNANLTTPKYIIRESEATLHISVGNSKIGKGIYGFSTLPGNKDHMLILKHSILLTDIPGTCSKYCTNCAKDGACYAWRDAKLHNNVTIRAWGENTLLLRNGALFGLVEAYITNKNKKYIKSGGKELPKITTFRVNVSGEIETLEELEGWNAIAKNHPEINFGLYTKNYEALEAFMNKHGDTEPNFVINVSQWHGCADEFLKKYPGKFNVFEYDDSCKKDKGGLSEEQIARLAALPHCPAVNKKGKHNKNAEGKPITCDGCKKCYEKRSGAIQTIAVYAH